MDIFKACQIINDHIPLDEEKAREKLIKLLDHCKSKKIPYNELINHLIRRLGLYPYLDTKTSSWQENFVYEAFKVNIGDQIKTLHREQSSVLKDLMSGKNLAIIAPTSFGKSFIIDAFIALKQPKNIAIIVPTIALTDETRRRLQRKFSNQYKIITTSEVELSEKNIFIFPQERALHYVDKIAELDMLVIDEFYKASADFDKDRSISLLNIILKIGQKAKQKYFLAPNISEIKANPFTGNMEIKRINFSTVFLNIHHNYTTISNNNKKTELLKILRSTNDKTLIYAGTYREIDNLSEIMEDKFSDLSNVSLDDFSQWVAGNYSKNWKLVNLIKKGTGIHNGRLHRSLSQIQIKLFNEGGGLKNIISTSSIIEGVNTSAKNIIFWGKKNGQSNLNYFGYKNLIGRGGRMFKHFIGEIYLLERPPADEAVQLSLKMQIIKSAPLRWIKLHIIYKPLNCIPIIFLKKPLSFQFVIGFCS
jgi:replicative superfamily II helicase